MTNPPTDKDIQEVIEWVTGMKLDDLLSDDEKPVTFWEINHRIQLGEHMYRKTKDVVHLKRAAKARSLLDEMGKRAQVGEYLNLKPSELDKLLSV